MSEIFLSRIAIQDFRTFGDFAIDIPAAPGLVLLTGTNGLGKSSFFDAIEWGLTNKIRRFEPYINKGRRKLVEKDYLTRRGAEPGSHSVALTFSDGDTVERNATGGTTMANIVAQLARPDRRTINDLGTYLALTHFLGQAAQQRFTSRDPQDQWQALKGPSGIDRLERIRAGLRGRATIAAFTRRLDAEQGVVATLDREIADWQGWMGRLERLRAAARATGVLTADEVAARIDQIENDLQQLAAGQPLSVTSESVGRRLAALGDRIGEALRTTGEQKAALEGLSALPAQFLVSQAEGRLDHPSLVRLRNAIIDTRARLDLASPLVGSTGAAVTAQTAAIATINQNIAVLDAARTDLARRAQLAELISTEQQDRTSLTEAIAAHRTTIVEADAKISQHGEASAEVARLRSLATSARTLKEAMAECLDLEGKSAAAKSALAQAREAAAHAASELVPLETQLADLESKIAEAERERAEADRHASAISAALSQLASHIHEDDSNCPVCQTSFEPGALKALADAAASGSDYRLAQADDALEVLRSTRSALSDEIRRLREVVAAVDGLERVARAAADAVTNARASIAKNLATTPESDLAALVATRTRDADARLAAAEAALEQLSANAAAATEQRSSVAADLDELIARDNHLGARLVQYQAEDKACADRIAARNLSNATIGDIDTKLTAERERGEDARARLAQLSEAATNASADVQREQAALDLAQRDLTAAEAARTTSEQAAQQMQQRWTRAGLNDIPSQAEYDRGLSAIDDVIGSLRSLAERQHVLGRENEDALLQSEIDEILASIRANGGDDGVRDPAAHLAALKSRLEAARAAVRLTTSARSAVNRYSEDLQKQADDFSARVLDPLNTVIDDFNEAMLSTPGESIQFKADTRVDATSFGMALRYREKVENAIETKKDLPPQIVLSEGQLAANGFSILCAASTAYPWSRWRALLLDDPLQHNDIIHTAAFVDVMRNMVELNGLQLIMSSHDRGESEFIARKFDAAGLPCSTVLLTAPSDKGVVWNPPEHNKAARLTLRKDARPPSVSNA
ncbi:DNA repair exonuclease SbcCD ATPase subunit [Rhizobium sp. SG_E_25_P2]|uniref:AAA family ATPase n=1 Tax=Rhizobium sp. SG_E_25_P2 TaxID=2879942 RepID=UPI002473BCEB|nr:AAA family ATPase [Rhizobium sp. SG_E_25_P2]MDH6268213.1 DNA repair exonuclease SbcCD ATPase subunit [Rhizobium sp. SG_E_25_P2]